MVFAFINVFTLNIFRVFYWIRQRLPTSINPETFNWELLRPSFSSQLVLPPTHMITSGKLYPGSLEELLTLQNVEQ